MIKGGGQQFRTPPFSNQNDLPTQRHLQIVHFKSIVFINQA